MLWRGLSKFGGDNNWVDIFVVALNLKTNKNDIIKR